MLRQEDIYCLPDSQEMDEYIIDNSQYWLPDSQEMDEYIIDNSQLTDVEEVQIDNSNLIASKFSSLYFDRRMTDVSLLVGGKSYPAHKLVLSASSYVFEIMFWNPIWKESRKRKVRLTENNRCSKVFEKFLRYLYTGKINLNHTSVLPVLVLADKYMVNDLIILCLDYMTNHVANAACHLQLVNWLEYSLRMGHYSVAQSCENFMRWNFAKVSSSPDFGNCDISVVERMVQQGDLVVTDEFEVCRGISNWLEVHEERLKKIPGINVAHEMTNIAERLIKHVRFPMLTSRQLAELLLSSVLILNKPFFIESMAFAMGYHTDNKPLIENSIRMEGPEGLVQFTPRLYTAEQYRCDFNIENYNSSQPYRQYTVMFSSQITIADHLGERTCDWVIDFFPKGVWFRKCTLIVVQGAALQVPESIQETVRITVTCQHVPKDGVKVKVGMLILGELDGNQHVVAATQSFHTFIEGDNAFNIDEFMSFNDLNSSHGTTNPSPFLSGPNKDTLKLVFIIAPICEGSLSDPLLPPLEHIFKKRRAP